MTRRYTLWLLGPVLAAALTGLLAGWWLEPLSGDLTRLGWWPERRFGWSGEQQSFEPPLARPGVLGVPVDIIVLGDSFSARQPLSQTPAGAYWPNWLARDTGLSVGVFDSYRVTMAELVASLPRLDPPPVAVIWQVVERYAPQRHGDGAAACVDAPAPRPRLAVSAPGGQVPMRYARRTAPSLAEPPIGYALQYLWRDGLRRLGLGPTTDVAVLALGRGGLFSNRDDRHMLVHRDELLKPAAGDTVWSAVACDLLAWQARVQGVAPTLFLAVVAPDRLTVYGDVLAAAALSRHGGIPAMAAERRLNLPRLDLAFRAAATRDIDLYLPNDTHWSSAGHALAARVVQDALVQHGALRQDKSRGAGQDPRH